MTVGLSRSFSRSCPERVCTKIFSILPHFSDSSWEQRSIDCNSSAVLICSEEDSEGRCSLQENSEMSLIFMFEFLFFVHAPNIAV